jgi:hypothetical protein
MRSSLNIALFIVHTAFTSAAGEVVLVRAETSARSIGQPNPEALLDQWTSNLSVLLREAGTMAKLEDEDILTSSDSKKVIILPHADYLSDAQILALKDHLEEGGGLWITGGTGYRDQAGVVRGWKFLEETLAGAIGTSRFNAGEAASFDLRFGHPGTCKLPPGYKLRLALTETPLFLGGGDKADIVAYWASDSYREIPSDSIPRDAAMVARALPSGGRVFWTGAGVEQFHLDPVNRAKAITLIGEVVQWLEGNGIPAVEAWPEGRQVGVLVHGDVEDQFQSIRAITDVLKKQRIPSTFNVLTAEAVKHPEAMEAILTTACELSIHGDNHAVFSGQAYELQASRIQNAAGFVALYGPAPTAFRPPELTYDDNTLRAAQNKGFTTFLACNHPDRDYPLYEPENRNAESALVMYPKSELDDYDLYGRLNIAGEEAKVHAMMDDFNRIRDVGGLYKINYHSQYIVNAEFPRVIENTLAQIKAYQGVWFADSKTITRWIQDRARLNLQSVSTSEQVRVTLTNTGPEPVKGVILKVLPPSNVPVELLKPTEVSQSCEYDVRDGALYAKIPLLKPGTIFRMDLGSSKRHPLSAISKKTLMTWIKVFFVVGGIFILWFVMYLAFSGGKVRSPRSLRESMKLTPSPESGTTLLQPIFSSLKPETMKPVFPVIPAMAVSVNRQPDAQRLPIPEPVEPAPEVRKTNPAPPANQTAISAPVPRLLTPLQPTVRPVPAMPVLKPVGQTTPPPRQVEEVIRTTPTITPDPVPSATEEFNHPESVRFTFAAKPIRSSVQDSGVEEATSTVGPEETSSRRAALNEAPVPAKLTRAPSAPPISLSLTPSAKKTAEKKPVVLGPERVPATEPAAAKQIEPPLIAPESRLEPAPAAVATVVEPSPEAAKESLKESPPKAMEMLNTRQPAIPEPVTALKPNREPVPDSSIPPMPPPSAGRIAYKTPPLPARPTHQSHSGLKTTARLPGQGSPTSGSSLLNPFEAAPTAPKKRAPAKKAASQSGMFRTSIDVLHQRQPAAPERTNEEWK